MSDSGTRINKFLSEVGYCSRRQADALIDQGRVYVNRKPAKMGMKVSEDDIIEVDGEKINQEVLCVQQMQELKKIILLIF